MKMVRKEGGGEGLVEEVGLDGSHLEETAMSWGRPQV